MAWGFTLTPEERERLIKKNKRNAERIFPYLGGEEVNTNPDQGFDRYVISFGDMSLEQAGEWPDLLSIVREKVKPERDKNNRENYRERWWLFGEGRPGLYAAIKPLKRCLVTARVTKHLCFSFQPTDRVFSEAMYVFSLPEFHRFAVLQSRVHEGWARLLSSSLEDRLRYSASDCFETFPFPSMGIVDAVARLESHGERLYKARAEHMLSQNYGLTDTYNRVKDASCEESAIVELRAMHEEMDRLALAAYGWEDIPVPAYQTATNDRERRALEAFEDEVIDRLFALNAQRADEERALGAGTAKPAGTKGKKKDPAQLGLLDEKPKDAARLKGGRNKK